MSDAEVEKVLSELRERVRVHTRLQTPPGGNPNSVHELDWARDRHLESLKANLAVMERTWNQLPPLISYRRGWLSRLELWLKRLIKTATRWFTWEQVNFNSATANSLKAALAVLAMQQRTLQEIEAQLNQLLTNETEPSNRAPVNHDGGEPGFGTDQEIEILAARIEELRASKSNSADPRATS